MRNDPFPKAYTPRELSQMSKRVKSEAEIRALTRRAEEPLPSISSGGERPVTRVYLPVFAEFLLYEMGASTYAEVVEAARRSLAGARS